MSQTTVIRIPVDRHRARRSNMPAVTDCAKEARRVRRAIDLGTRGPQVEGMPTEELSLALADPRTITLRWGRGAHPMTWPLLVPLEHNSTLHAEFLASRYGGRSIYSYLRPPAWVGDARIVEALRESRTDLRRAKAVIVIDESDDRIDALTGLLGKAVGPHHEDRFVDPESGSEAAVAHYSVAFVADRDAQPAQQTSLAAAFREAVDGRLVDPTPASGTALYTLDQLKSLHDQTGATYLERLFAAHQRQSDDVLAAHPVRQSHTEQELVAMCADDATAIAVHTEQGAPLAACFVVESLAACPWLRAPFFERTFPGERLVCFPCIVSDSRRRGDAAAQAMGCFLAQLARRAGSRYRAVSCCTNLTEQNVATVVGRFASEACGTERKVDQFWRYAYRTLVL
jgi:hypothetical protein